MGVAENFDLHDHSSGKNLGVRRVQTTSAPAAAGQVQVNANTWQWWASSAAAVRTAVDVEGAQTISGAKTFSTTLTVSAGGIAVQASGGLNISGAILMTDAAARIIPGATSFAIRNNADTVNNVYVGNGGIVGLNDTTSAFMTIGLVVNQLGNDNEILALKSSDVAHGMTSLADTTSYLTAAKISATAGGGTLAGYSSSTTAVFVSANHTTDDTAKTSSALGHVLIAGWTKSGTTSATPGATANLLALRGGSTTRFLLDNAGALYSFGSTTNDKIGNGLWFLNDSSNANMTQGLTLNQGAADDEIFSLKSSDVVHGVTNLTETDSYFTLGKLAASGGTKLQALGGTSSSTALNLTTSCAGAGDTTKSTAAVGVVTIDASRFNGTTVQALQANGNLFAVTSAGACRFIVDVEGDIHCDSGSATANSGTGYLVYDDYDDAHLIRALDVERGGAGLVRDRFDAFLKYGRAHLSAARIAVFNDGGDGSVFVNYSALVRLHSGAIWQMHTRLMSALEKIDALETRLALKEG